jgi:hypothetical protein
MGRMRTCATASVVAIIGIPFVVSFLACASGSPAGGTTPDTGVTGEKKAESGEVRKDEPKTDAPNSGATTATKPVETAAAAQPRPMTAAECAKLPPESVDEAPDAGVVMNNAQTAADAGKSDRFTGVSALLQAHRKSFRCCFDIWASNHLGEAGKILWEIELAPDGSVKSSAAKKDESSPMAGEIEPCMTEVTKAISFPKSPSGRDTRFKKPFDFKPLTKAR